MTSPRRLSPLILLAVAGCGVDPCANEVVRSVSEPGGDHRAVLFQRDCGATTDFSSQVSILRPGQTLSGSGNAFAADSDHGRATAASGSGPWVEVRWLGPNQLLISYDARARTFARLRQVGPVVISYQPVQR